jgi:4-amino-4-deoxy-L-arabinose transferase-like glycosyltransferase
MNGPRARGGDVLLLAALVAVASVWPLLAPAIGTHGEAREGLVVQDIVRHGRWILPLRNGEVPSKPPLYHWIAAAVGDVLGLSDAVVRLPSALAAGVVLLLVLVAGVAAGGRAAGWLAVGALAGTYPFVESASEARVDMFFAACLTVSLLSFLSWYRGRDRRARAACYLAVAGAVLTKGPAGAVLPALVIVAFLARERRLDELRVLWSWPLVGVVAVIDVGWYALAYWVGGAEFVARQIVRENLDRFVGRGVFGQHGGRSRLMMVGNLATDLLPWNLVLPWAAVRWWRGTREDTIGRFLHCWWIVIVAFFTIAYGKRGVYLLPLYPAVALLAGRALAGVPARRATAIAAAVAVVDLAVLLVGQGVRVHRATRDSLVPFARVVRDTVPPDADLVADRSLAESDRLVMAYRLQRDLPQPHKRDCRPGTYRLVSPRDGAIAGTPRVTSERRGVPVALVQDTAATCPLAPGSRHGR